MTHQQLRIKSQQQAQKIEELSQLLEEKSERIEQLEFEIANLNKLVFGAKRERFTGGLADPLQSQLFDTAGLELAESTEPATSSPEQQAAGKKKKRRKPTTFKRNSFPPHLPREVQLIEPQDFNTDDPQYTKIGENVTEILKYHPAHLTVKKIIRPKYIKKNDEDAGVKQALVPPRLIPSGIVDESLIAGLICEKILHHTPVHRFNKKLKQAGVNFMSDSNLYNWFHRGAEVLMVLQEQIRKDMLALNYNQVDETTITVLAKNKKNASHRGYMWVMYNPTLKAVLFNYHPSRSKIAATELVGNQYTGVLQADGYNVYPSLAKNSGIELIHCMAHARRKFAEAENNDPPKAAYVLEKMQVLYQIERHARKKQFDHKAREQLRQQKALPVLNELKSWFDDTLTRGKILPKSAIGKAISYSLARWRGLCAYVYNGTLEIDNNLVENTIRPIALGRKNYLFAGSHSGADSLACLYTIVGTAKHYNLNVQNYLTWLFQKIAAEKMTDANIKSCLPYNFTAQQTDQLKLSG